MGRVCERCSRRVFAGLPGPPVSETPGGADVMRVAGPILFFELVVVATAVVFGGGLSNLDPALLIAAWGTFVIWVLAPSGDPRHTS
jgi:hypothetical protein